MSCHLVLGDCAADLLRISLGPYADIRIHRDDLAVGPLIDIDDAYPAARVHFWDAVFPQSSFDFNDVLPAGNAQLASLPADLTLWIGNSCGEALLLRRLAWWRYKTQQTFKLLSPDSTGLNSYIAGQVPLSLMPLPIIQATNSQTLSPALLQELASEWQAIRQQPSAFRGWNGSSFHHHTQTALDAEMLALIEENYLPCSEIASRWISTSSDFFRSDVLAMWRLRGLAEQDLIELCPHPDEYWLFAFKARRKIP
uniref:DUF3658 domain-containing protein n=1 Tax=Iodobacter sp. CM08 TaxID=3085902 RepID=UPI002982B15F|nr:DUF3658 domain-containing protein [Iodobacter sp. CM08]